jgi:hypothetical protein
MNLNKNIEHFILPPPEQIINNPMFKPIRPYIEKYNIDIYELYSVLEYFDKPPSEITNLDLESRKKYLYIFKHILDLEYDTIINNKDPNIINNIENIKSTRKLLKRIIKLLLNESIINTNNDDNKKDNDNDNINNDNDNDNNNNNDFLHFFGFIILCIIFVYIVYYFNK